MTTYRIRFAATVEREVEVPNDFTWSEAYDFARDQLGWHALAHSAAARITIDTDRVVGFNTPKYIQWLRDHPFGAAPASSQ
jgi:hypothetical protein